MKVSLIASSTRPQLYPALINSLKDTTVDYEIVFAGPSLEAAKNQHIEYIITEDIKPAQCYEIARQASIGEIIVWIADDCEFPNDIIGKAYRYWKEQNNKKLILSLQTKEIYPYSQDHFCDMKNHSFIGGDPSTPLMAPIAMISREYLSSLGGFDRRFLCGQYENLTVCMAYEDGATVEIFGDRENYVEIDHIGKSIECGESRNKKDFFTRPFALGYQHDRQILESSCEVKGRQVKVKTFEPYAHEKILFESQSHKGHWK